jgi:hypothetical protein
VPLPGYDRPVPEDEEQINESVTGTVEAGLGQPDLQEVAASMRSAVARLRAQAAEIFTLDA